jgi:hypothetical protein
MRSTLRLVTAHAYLKLVCRFIRQHSKFAHFDPVVLADVRGIHSTPIAHAKDVSEVTRPKRALSSSGAGYGSLVLREGVTQVDK